MEDSNSENVNFSVEGAAIIQALPYPVFVISNEGEIAFQNSVAIELLVDLGLEDRLPDKIERLVKKTIKGNSDYMPVEVADAVLLRRNEKEFWYLPRIFLIKDKVGKSNRGWAVELVDVSKVRWIDEIKGDLIGTVSHDLKTPMTGIRMILHLLAEQKVGTLNKKQLKMVDSAKDDCERMLETLENLLQLSRLEIGKPSLSLESTDPGTLVEDAVELISDQAREMDLTLEVAVEKSLPAVFANKERIGQVITNFLSNAIRHSPSAGRISLSAKCVRDAFIRISVVDQGEGIPLKEQGKIFDRFYSNEDGSSSGSGLGLWICKEIVRAHGGVIGVKSSSDRDTEFYFELPCGSE